MKRRVAPNARRLCQEKRCPACQLDAVHLARLLLTVCQLACCAKAHPRSSIPSLLFPAASALLEPEGGRARHGSPLSLSIETCWADAFIIPPAPVPEAPAPAPGAEGNEADAEGDESDDPDEPFAPDVPAAAPAGPDSTAQLQLPVAAVRLSQELPAPPAFLEVALTEALPELIGTRIDSAVRALLGSPAWPQEAHGFWATAFLGIVLSEGGQGVNKLLAWLWRHSAPSAIGIAEKPGYGASVPMLPSPSSQRPQQLQQRSELLNRYHVREFACAVLVLLRHKAVARTQPRNVLPAAHDMLCNELVHLEAEDLHSAVRIMQSVPQWRLDGLPLPARSVVLPGGATLTAEQISIIQVGYTSSRL